MLEGIAIFGGTLIVLLFWISVYGIKHIINNDVVQKVMSFILLNIAIMLIPGIFSIFTSAAVDQPYFRLMEGMQTIIIWVFGLIIIINVLVNGFIIIPVMYKQIMKFIRNL